jgi:hypothetical protein
MDFGVRVTVQFALVCCPEIEMATNNVRIFFRI